MAHELVLRGGLQITQIPGSGTGDPQLTLDTATKTVGEVPAVDASTFISTTLATGKIIVGNNSNIATAVTISGVISLSSGGVTTLQPDTIFNANVNAAAAIAYSKLNLAGGIVNGDINASAAITRTKLAAGTAYRVIVNNSSGIISELTALTAARVLVSDANGQPIAANPTTTEINFVAGVTSAIQTQLGNKLAFSSAITPANGDLIYFTGGVWTRLPIGTSGQTLLVTGGLPAWGAALPNGIPTGGTAGQYLNKIDGTNYNTQWSTFTLSKVTDVTATFTEVNKLSGVTTTTAQFNYLSTATSDIQTQLNSKLPLALAQNAMWYGNSSNVAVQLSPGTAGYVLKSVGGVPTWQPDSLPIFGNGNATTWNAATPAYDLGGTLVQNTAINGHFNLAMGSTIPLALFSVFGGLDLTTFSSLALNQTVAQLRHFEPAGITSALDLTSTGIGLVGDITWGTGFAGAARTLTAAGSATDVSININPKGAGFVNLVNSTFQFELVLGSPILSVFGTGPFTIFGPDGSTSNGKDIYLKAGDGGVVSGSFNGGNVYLSGGLGSGTGVTGNVGFGTSAGSFGGGSKVVFVVDAAVNPASNPTGGFILYSDAANASHPTVKLPSGAVIDLTAAGFTNPMTTVGDIIQGTTAGAPIRLASVATGNALISGGVATLNSWGKITSAHVDATVQVAGLSWLLTGTSTLTGVAIITSNTKNQHIFNGTWTATAASDDHMTFGGTLTAASGLGVTGYAFGPTINAVGTSSVQVAVDIMPTFSGGTTPVNIGLRVQAGGVIIGPFSGFVVPATPDILLMRQDQNAQTGVSLINATSGTGAYTQFVVSSSATLATALLMRTFSAGFTSGGINVANTSVITSTTSGGFNIGTFTANQLSAWTNNVERARFLSTGEFLVGYTATTASEYFGIRKDVNSFTRVQIVNATSGTTAFTQFAISNSTTLATALTINTFSAGYTTSGLNVANSASLSSNMTAGFIIGTVGAQPLSFYTNSVKVLIIDGAGNTTLTQPALSSAWLPIIAFTPGAHTSMTATAEFIDYDFKTRTATWLAGTTATQRFAYFRGQTVAGASASATFTDLYTVYIDPSIVGSNAIVTNNWALGLGGGLKLFAGTTTRPALVLPTGTNLTSSLAGAIENDGTHLWVTFANGGARAQLDNQVTSFGWALAGNTLVADGIIGDVGTGGFKISLYTNNTAKQVISSKGNFTFTQDTQSVTNTFVAFNQAAHTGGEPSGVIYTGGSHTGITKSVNFTDIFFNAGGGISTQFVTGNIATSSMFQISGARLLSFVGASTITDAASVYIFGSPQAHTNATFTNVHALLISAAATVSAGAATNSYGLTVNAQTGATSNYSAQFLGGLGIKFRQAAQSTTHTFIDIVQATHTAGAQTAFKIATGGGTGLSPGGFDIFLTTATQQFITGAVSSMGSVAFQGPTWQFAGASTVTDAYATNISYPQAHNNATFTNAHGLLIQSRLVTGGTGVVTNSFGISINAATGATNNYAAQFLGGNVGIGLSAPLSTLDVSGSIGSNTRTITTSATLAATDHTVLCDSTGGVVAVTLPTASGAKGRIYVVKKINAGANNVTLATVDGGTKTITTQYTGFAVQSDGSLWYVIGSF